uniref:Uncharacterized protein n=1 Tax=uncultured Phormidium sp. TaxID=259949 RepID=W0FFU9_9CYAN|nr:hypothetical protein [uncultured Phormidium sp.]
MLSMRDRAANPKFLLAKKVTFFVFLTIGLTKCISQRRVRRNAPYPLLFLLLGCCSFDFPTKLNIPAKVASCLNFRNIHQTCSQPQSYANNSFQPFLYFYVNIVFYLKFQRLTDIHPSWQKNQPLTPTPTNSPSIA